jgi:hypothetical protein
MYVGPAATTSYSRNGSPGWVLSPLRKLRLRVLSSYVYVYMCVCVCMRAKRHRYMGNIKLEWLYINVTSTARRHVICVGAHML